MAEGRDQNDRKYIAHAKGGGAAPHGLQSHLKCTSALARNFAEVWGAGNFAAFAALWHDLGKFSPAFQAMIRSATGEDSHLDKTSDRTRKRVDHSTAGALHACLQLGEPGMAAAVAIAGHHAGLADFYGPGGLEERLAVAGPLLKAATCDASADILAAADGQSVQLPQTADRSLWIRMLASALFDADFLNTEDYFDAERRGAREGWADIEALASRLDGRLAEKFAGRTGTVNQLRAQVLAACRKTAHAAPGLFTLANRDSNNCTVVVTTTGASQFSAANRERLFSRSGSIGSRALWCSNTASSPRASRNTSAVCSMSVVLCTATQPALHAVFPDLPPAREIAPPCLQMPERVRIQFPEKGTRRSWVDIATAMASVPQALAIVNSRADCRTLHALLPPGALHLSTWQCAAHRAKLLAALKDGLPKGRPAHVVATSLIEAGVDISFPLVFRALAGLDSIAQAAGRCNRENERPGEGRVVAFRPEGGKMGGHLLQTAQATEDTLRGHGAAPFTADAFEHYFKALYWSRGDLDEYRMGPLLGLGAPSSFRQAVLAKKVSVPQGAKIGHPSPSPLL